MDRSKPGDVRADELADVSHFVVLEDGTRHRCSLLDLNAHGAISRVTAVPFERFVVGRRFELSFERAGLEEIVMLLARLQYKVQEGEALRLAWAFPQPEAAWQILQPAFGSRVNRRRDPRFLPNPEAPLRLRLHARLSPTRSLLTEARVLDLSASGVALLLRRSLASELDSTTPLDLHLDIPEHGEPVTIPARLRYCRPGDDGWRCGIEFDATAADFAMRRAPLLDYLTGCHEAVPET